MNLFRPACGKPALLIFSVAVILFFLASSRVMAEPWPIKHFEVVNVEPGGEVGTGRRLDDLGATRLLKPPPGPGAVKPGGLPHQLTLAIPVRGRRFRN